MGESSKSGGGSNRSPWRFSLSGLFRTVTIAALAMFAAIHFGPLAAARDVGIALAICLAFVAFATRSRRHWLASGLVAAAGLIPTMLAAGAPFSNRSAVCMECGMARNIEDVCGWTTKDVISETDASRWAAPMLPAGHVHNWTICSVHSRSHWFGSAPIGCGGPGEGVHMAWQLARLGDQAAGERAFREYQDIRAGKSTKSLAVHRQEVAAAVNAAATASR
jgi:hypothetical protein